MVTFAILISGRGSNMLALHDVIKTLPDQAEIISVCADKACDGLIKADERGLPTKLVSYQNRKKSESEAEMIAHLQSLEPDFILLAGFMRILSAEFTAAFAGKIINIHPSLLPKYKGLDTHQRALENGDRRHGASIHIVTPALDDGPVILQASIAIADNDSADQLANRLLPVEHWLYGAVVRALATDALNITDQGHQWINQPVIPSDLAARIENQPSDT